ncbi:hypothetical protein B0H21DRAFT_543804 [Amylocystis lapponica]|nr:hypothetical protein B0H21DRAFT_543804 [Amylocystis lapponica]
MWSIPPYSLGCYAIPRASRHSRHCGPWIVSPASVESLALPSSLHYLTLSLHDVRKAHLDGINNPLLRDVLSRAPDLQTLHLLFTGPVILTPLTQCTQLQKPTEHAQLHRRPHATRHLRHAHLHRPRLLAIEFGRIRGGAVGPVAFLSAISPTHLLARNGGRRSNSTQPCTATSTGHLRRDRHTPLPLAAAPQGPHRELRLSPAPPRGRRVAAARPGLCALEHLALLNEKKYCEWSDADVRAMASAWPRAAPGRLQQRDGDAHCLYIHPSRVLLAPEGPYTLPAVRLELSHDPDVPLPAIHGLRELAIGFCPGVRESWEPARLAAFMNAVFPMFRAVWKVPFSV